MDALNTENHSLVLIGAIVLIGLVPFALAMVTSFAKLMVVGGLLRQGLGAQQVPPTAVITGLAFVITLHVMSPLLRAGLDAYERRIGANASDREVAALGALDDTGTELQAFLRANTSEKYRRMIRDLGVKQADAGTAEEAASRSKWLDLAALDAPAFLLTELEEAFMIGVILLLPFLVIDLVVSNVLMSMGMMMVSPQIITLPLKLLFFVSIDGWGQAFSKIAIAYRYHG